MSTNTSISNATDSSVSLLNNVGKVFQKPTAWNPYRVTNPVVPTTTTASNTTAAGATGGIFRKPISFNPYRITNPVIPTVTSSVDGGNTTAATGASAGIFRRPQSWNPYRVSLLPNNSTGIDSSGGAVQQVKPAGAGVFWSPITVGQPQPQPGGSKLVTKAEIAAIVLVVIAFFLVVAISTWICVQRVRRRSRLQARKDQDPEVQGKPRETQLENEKRKEDTMVEGGLVRSTSFKLKRMFAAARSSARAESTRWGSDDSGSSSCGDLRSSSSHASHASTSSATSYSSSSSTPTHKKHGTDSAHRLTIRASSFEWTWNWDSDYAEQGFCVADEIAPVFPRTLNLTSPSTTTKVEHAISPRCSVDLTQASASWTRFPNRMLGDDALGSPTSSYFSDDDSDDGEDDEDDAQTEEAGLPYIPSLAHSMQCDEANHVPRAMGTRRRSHTWTAAPAPALPSIVVSAPRAENKPLKRSHTHTIRRKPPPSFFIESPPVTAVVVTTTPASALGVL